jgi:hypothetical protein
LVEVNELIIAGWTGRDEDALKKHIRELEELGVKPPKTTPIFYRVSANLFTHATEIQVSGPDTSGEVEFVLIQTKNDLRVAVGSDHTDRKAETIGVTLSKQLCAKPVSVESWAYEDVRPHWNRLVLRSFIRENNSRVLYQEGTVDAMRSPEDLLARRPLKDSEAMFCGTFAAKGGIRPSTHFEMELEDPVLRRRLTHAYAIRALAVEG